MHGDAQSLNPLTQRRPAHQRDDHWTESRAIRLSEQFVQHHLRPSDGKVVDDVHYSYWPDTRLDCPEVFFFPSQIFQAHEAMKNVSYPLRSAGDNLSFRR